MKPRDSHRVTLSHHRHETQGKNHSSENYGKEFA